MQSPENLTLAQQLPDGPLLSLVQLLKPAYESDLAGGPFQPRRKLPPEDFLKHFIRYAVLAGRLQLPFMQPGTHPAWKELVRLNPDLPLLALDVNRFSARLKQLGLRRPFEAALADPQASIRPLFPIELVRLESEAGPETLARDSEVLHLRYPQSAYRNLDAVGDLGRSGDSSRLKC